MATIIEVANAMYKDRYKWENISDKDKEDFFFIFNRYFSKRYLKESQLLNIKSIDKVSGMNIWFEFMKNQPYPKWFWSKSQKEDKDNISKSQKAELMKSFKIDKLEDLEYLISKYPDLIKEEIEFQKKKNKQ